MTIPVYVLGAVSLIAQVYFSDKIKRRAVFIIGSCVPVVIGYTLCVESSRPVVGYMGMFILVLGKSHLRCSYATQPKLTFDKGSILFPP